jgi:cob(I)alamin adenosyltransferase
MPEEKEKKHGLVVIHTGDGKGKTTAALGIAIRATPLSLRLR